MAGIVEQRLLHLPGQLAAQRSYLYQLPCPGNIGLGRSAMEGEEERFKTGGGIELAQVIGETADPRIGQVINGYRLEAVLGQGGMGTVYRANKTDGELDRSVALKLVGPGFPITRFLQERQIQAQLSHPNIARLYDAGTAEDGSPYIVMELIDGEPIDAYVNQHGLSLAQRLDLLLEVVDAVAYAHANLIVHRDIKPSNVLVDSDQRARLLDFGIAKPLSDDDQTLTATSRPLTPNYASPEQVIGKPVGIASDIYQLGALIAQVCSGRSPFADQSLQGAVNRASEDFAHIVPEVRASLPADLLAVVAKALRPDSEARYTDANALAADLRRYLAGYPVQAKNPGPIERLGKLMRRHPLATAATFLVIGSAIIASFLYTAGLAAARDRAEAANREAQLQRAQARQEAEVSREVTQFLTNLFRSADPTVGNTADLTARELLDRGVGEIDRLADQPQVQAALQRTMGDVYTTIGLYEKARPLLEAALENSGDPAEKIRSTTALATLHREIGEYDAALQLLEPLVRSFEHAEVEIRDAYAARYQLVLTYNALGQYEKAPAHLDLLTAASDKVSADQRLSTLLERAWLSYILGDWQDSIQLYEEAIDQLIELEGPDSAKMGQIYQSLGNLYSDRNELELAHQYYSNALSLFEAIYGPGHPLVGGAAGSLGSIAWKQNDLDAATRYFQQVTEIMTAARGPEHPDTANGYGALGLVHIDKGEHEEAIRLLEKTNRILEANFAADSLPLTTSRSFLAKAYLADGQYEEAENLLALVLEVRNALLPADDLRLLESAHYMLQVLRAQGRDEDAEQFAAKYDFAPLHAALGTEPE
jgi:serine/threonine-protein kinase